jgi:nucleoside-diphosphate-sugar epimerase
MSKGIILVTGSEGLIGKALVKNLKSKNYDVIEFDIKNNEDILNKLLVKEKIKSINGVVHLAAVSRVITAYKDPEKSIMTNILGTTNILEAIRKINPKCWMIFASSREVYGETNKKIKEDDQLNPLNVYGSTKLAGENICISYRKNYSTETYIVRFSNVYGGKNDHPDRVIPIFLHQALNNLDITVNGGEQMFDFVHLDDTIEGLSILIEKIMQKQIQSEVFTFHFVTGTGTKLMDLVKKIKSVTNSNSSIKFLSARNYDVETFVGDPTRTEKILGWQSKISLEEGLKKYKELMT